ncbi:MAG TPA: AAA family ATPase, partial [Candidatus Saccharimonadales bacterium]|nr:AAA family ATPase [Candidatus Saccharimonadales bacterium]
INLASLKADESALRKELESAGVQFRGRACKCPFHDDRSPSAGIYFKEGAWKFKCQGCGFGGDIIDIRAKLNQRTPVEELRSMQGSSTTARPAKSSPPAPKIFPSVEAIAASLPHVEDVYTDLYADPNTGKATFSVIRWRNAEGKKAFTQCSATAGGWWMKAPAEPLPIANRAAIRDAETVLVVEGEKCVRALQSVGIPSTTAPGGANKGAAEKADWTPLAGKTVILWPDNDEPDKQFPEGKGIAHMRNVQRILQQTLTPAPQIHFLDPATVEMGPKQDAADFVARYRGWKPDEIRVAVLAALDEAKPVGIVADFAKFQEDIIAGQLKMLSFPFRSLSALTNALMPATVTAVCGDAGATKSLFVSECLVEWTIVGVRACVLHLEDDRNFHLSRALAQLDRNAGHTEFSWIAANPDAARAGRIKHAATLEEIGRCIWEAPTRDQVTHEMALTWVRERAKAGFEIIIIDPVTALEASDKPWIADLRFVMDVKAVARQYGTRIILVTHPKKGRKNGSGLDDFAGAAAYTRFAHSALWLEKYQPEKHANVRRTKYQQEQLSFNRTINIAKARNGRGTGLELAYQFSPLTLRFEELGIVWEGQA